MSDERLENLIAVVVGNSSIRAGRFDAASDGELPGPTASVSMSSDSPELDRLGDLISPDVNRFFVASVRSDAEARLRAWVAQRMPEPLYQLLSHDDFPLSITVDEPAKVGTDRLAGAVAVNFLRRGNLGAIFIDSGTALTVNAVSRGGHFIGGAILPGLKMSSKALAADTDLLPHVLIDDLSDSTPSLGANTESAIRSGLFWGAVGAICQITDQLTAAVGPDPDIFLTGGGMEPFVRQIGRNARYLPHLVIRGIAATAHHLSLNVRES